METFWNKVYEVMKDFEWDEATAYEYVSAEFPELVELD